MASQPPLLLSPSTAKATPSFPISGKASEQGEYGVWSGHVEVGIVA